MMSADISDGISLVAAVTAFLAYLEAKKATRQGRNLEALRKVVEAADKTETYIALGKHDRRKENELAELWSEAAFLISNVDKKLAFRLNMKSKFWRDPNTWTPEDDSRIDISLRTVRADAERLLEQVA
jgi:hypothetical protein